MADVIDPTKPQPVSTPPPSTGGGILDWLSNLGQGAGNVLQTAGQAGMAGLKGLDYTLAHLPLGPISIWAMLPQIYDTRMARAQDLNRILHDTMLYNPYVLGAGLSGLDPGSPYGMTPAGGAPLPENVKQFLYSNILGGQAAAERPGSPFDLSKYSPNFLPTNLPPPVMSPALATSYAHQAAAQAGGFGGLLPLLLMNPDLAKKFGLGPIHITPHGIGFDLQPQPGAPEEGVGGGEGVGEAPPPSGGVGGGGPGLGRQPSPNRYLGGGGGGAGVARLQPGDVVPAFTDTQTGEKVPGGLVGADGMSIRGFNQKDYLADPAHPGSFIPVPAQQLGGGGGGEGAGVGAETPTTATTPTTAPPPTTTLPPQAGGAVAAPTPGQEPNAPALDQAERFLNIPPPPSTAPGAGPEGVGEPSPAFASPAFIEGQAGQAPAEPTPGVPVKEQKPLEDVNAQARYNFLRAWQLDPATHEAVLRFNADWHRAHPEVPATVNPPLRDQIDATIGPVTEWINNRIAEQKMVEASSKTEPATQRQLKAINAMLISLERYKQADEPLLAFPKTPIQADVTDLLGGPESELGRFVAPTRQGIPNPFDLGETQLLETIEGRARRGDPRANLVIQLANALGPEAARAMSEVGRLTNWEQKTARNAFVPDPGRDTQISAARKVDNAITILTGIRSQLLANQLSPEQARAQIRQKANPNWLDSAFDVRRNVRTMERTEPTQRGLP